MGGCLLVYSSSGYTGIWTMVAMGAQGYAGHAHPGGPGLPPCSSRTTTRLPPTHVAITDCEPVRRAFIKRYSPSIKLNGIIQALHRFGRDIRACWIPTGINTADPFSRRCDFVPPMSPVTVSLPDATLWNLLMDPSYTGAAPRIA